LSYGIVKEHGGSIRVGSTLGEGACFVIDLPAASTEPATSDTSSVPAAPALPFDGRGKKVLVVDDEDSILNLIHDALVSQGYQLDVARSGEAALRNSQQTHY